MKTSQTCFLFVLFMLMIHGSLYTKSEQENKRSACQNTPDRAAFQSFDYGGAGCFKSSNTIEDPRITLIGDAAVVLEYESVYDVHTPPDPVTYPNMRSQPANFDRLRILDDLETVIDPDHTDFVLLYTLQEVPGWIKNGMKCFVAAENIGLPNAGFGPAPPHWPELRSVIHMNSVDLLDRSNPAFPDLPDYGGTLTAFHEMGHFWCVYIPFNNTIGPADWDPALHPVGYLASCGAHWAGIWEGDGLPGIMLTGPNSTQFNAFDLYLMGLSEYKTVRDTVYRIANSNTGTRVVYDVTIDDLIDALALAGPDYYSGIGHRYPNLEPEAADLHTLIVIVQGRDEHITGAQRDRVIALADAIPAGWHHATRELSNMDVHVEIKDGARFTDQAQTLADYGYWLRETIVRWQEFIPQLNILHAVELYVQRSGSAGNIRVEIRTHEDAVLGMATLNESDIPASGWVRIGFPAALALTPGEKYRIAAYTDHESADPANRYFWRGTNDPLYDHTCVSSEYEGNPDFDFAFKTIGTFVTHVDNHQPMMPASSLLVRNYPNPFNSKTVIEFELPESAFVTVRIVNSLGQYERLLTREWRESGKHTVQWDAGSRPSGVYGVIVQAGDQTWSRKCLLLK
ncbi:T9SS type A sorting domain-containing protein [bacterium]|nr:T9SS type A sorting domain-containing protein [bacterium]